MIREAMCIVYAHSVAAIWAGLGVDMRALGSCVLFGDSILRVAPGCLAARAMMLATVGGGIGALCLHRPILMVKTAVMAAGLSWARVFLLVGVWGTEWFSLLHDQWHSQYIVFVVPVIYVLFCMNRLWALSTIIGMGVLRLW